MQKIDENEQQDPFSKSHERYLHNVHNNTPNFASHNSNNNNNKYAHKAEPNEAS